MDDEAFFKDDITKGKLSGAIPLLGGQKALKRPEGVCSGRSHRALGKFKFCTKAVIKAFTVLPFVQSPSTCLSVRRPVFSFPDSFALHQIKLTTFGHGFDGCI